MNFIENTIAWCRSEIFGSFIYLASGLLLLLFTFGFWRIGTTEFSKAIVIPFLVVSLIAIAASTTLIISNKNRIANFNQEYKEDTKTFQKNELKRIENVLSGYRPILIGVGTLMVISVLMYLFFQSPLIKSIALAIMLSSFLSFMLEHFSQERSKIYQKKIMEIMKKE